jgi:prolyl oligopeptidase
MNRTLTWWLCLASAGILIMPDADLRAAGDAEAAARLHALFQSEWERSMRENPTWASELGDLRYNDRWEDLRFEAIAASNERSRQVLNELHALDFDALSPEDQLNYRLFEREYALRVEAFDFRWWLVPLNQRGGIQDAGSLADSLSFTRIKDYEDWIARMRAFPESMQQTIALMRAGASEGIIHPRVIMERLPAQIERQIVEDPEDQLFFKPFKTFSDDIPAAEQERLAADARAAISECILPAYREFQQFFNDEYLPACLPEVGVWQLPRGDELYALRCREFTTTDLTPEQIHQIGLGEVRRIRAEMEQIVREVQFEGSFAEFLEQLRTDPQFYYENPNDLLAAYQAVCKKIDPQLVRLFKRLPRIPYGVEEIPAHIAPDTTTAYYRPPAADGSRAGTYFVNLFRPEVRPRYEMEALSLHEAVPGHHLQIALAQELEDLPEFRRYGGYTAYVEGWALYAESLGDELGLYQDPYSRFGQLTYEMWRAVRLVVDTGIHHLHWTRQEAIDFFAENTAKTQHDIENEIDRYIAWPGQALAYKIGELRIRELRRRAEAELGDKFDVREFHDVVLRQGAVPLDVLESIVADWIAGQTAS